MITRTEYTKTLVLLDQEVGELGMMVAGEVRDAGSAVGGDRGKAATILASRREAVRIHDSIEGVCMSLMLLQQPLARDIRQVTAAFRLAPDLNRIDEMACDIATLADELPSAVEASVAEPLANLAGLAATMVERAVEAYLTSDERLARTVFSADDGVDRAYCRVRDDVVAMLASGAGDEEGLPELLMVAKYFERTGDHAQSIADWAIFRATGSYRGHPMGGGGDE